MRGGSDGRQAGRTVLAVVLAAIVAAQLGGCARTVAGTPKALGAIDAGMVAGLPIDPDAPNGPRGGVRDAELDVDNAAGDRMDTLAVNALADIFTYWEERLPADFDERFAEPKRLVSFDSQGEAVRLCGASTAKLVNAFYCGSEDTVAWDRGVLLPMLDDMFGEMAVVSVLAHEMGHAVQFQLREKSNIAQGTPTIVKEQQADCYAGGFFRWVAEGKSEHFALNLGDGLNKVLATIFFIRDPAGFDAGRKGAHGLAFDRVFAFQEGFAKGPKRCAEMDLEEIRQRITEKAREEADEEDSGEVDITDQRYLDLLQQSLDTAFQAGDDAPKIDTRGATCDSGKATEPAAYCQDENVVAIDLDQLKRIGTPPRKGQEPGVDGAGIGDFAAFGEVASRYTLGIQKAAGISLDDGMAGLRTACLTGAWTAFTESPDADLQLAIGDLDEAVAELLGERSLIAADVNGEQIPSGFARVEAFRVGYFAGSAPCTENFS